jgi:hypothetical protein
MGDSALVFLVHALSLLVVLALLFRITGASFPGRRWLHVFIGLSFAAPCIGWVVTFVSFETDDPEKLLGLWFIYMNPVVVVVSYICLLLFAVELKRSHKAPDGEPQAAGFNRGINKLWYLPPNWLLGTTVGLSVACLIHSIDGSVLRNVVGALTSTDITGKGEAYDYARELEFSSEVADAAGALYIATALSWLASVFYATTGLLQNRAKRQAGS